MCWYADPRAARSALRFVQRCLGDSKAECRHLDAAVEPRELFVGVGSLVLEYVSASGQLAAEVVFFDDENMIARYVAHYRDE